MNEAKFSNYSIGCKEFCNSKLVLKESIHCIWTNKYMSEMAHNDNLTGISDTMCSVDHVYLRPRK